MSTWGSPGRSAAATVTAAVTGPPAVSSRQETERGCPVRVTAASCVAKAARNGRSTNAPSGLPVAYPVGAPSSSAALLLARRIVPSCSSRNSGTGACWNTACSRRRSVRTDSGSTSPGPSTTPGSAAGAAPIASMAASSSVRAASIRVRRSVPGSPAAWRRASRRDAMSATASLRSSASRHFPATLHVALGHRSVIETLCHPTTGRAAKRVASRTCMRVVADPVSRPLGSRATCPPRGPGPEDQRRVEARAQRRPDVYAALPG